jgi:hypothetical protein
MRLKILSGFLSGLYPLSIFGGGEGAGPGNPGICGGGEGPGVGNPG